MQSKAWMMAINLSDAYMHFPIRVNHRKFLRFQLEGVPYQFRVVPFGMATALRVFTQVLVPIAAAQIIGAQVYPYLDNWLVVVNTSEQVVAMTWEVIKSLQKRGFLINWRKSMLTPTRRLVFIGGSFHDRSGSPPIDRVYSILECIYLSCNDKN